MKNRYLFLLIRKFVYIIVLIVLQAFNLNADNKVTPLNISFTPSIALFKNPVIVGLDYNIFYGKSKKVYGIQFGMMNRVEEKMYGLQISMAFSVIDEFYGVQLYGMFNRIYRAKGLQIGIYNSVEYFNGIQIGLFYNSVNYFKGIQIGFFANVGRQLEDAGPRGTLDFNGFQFGFINAVKKMKGIQMGIINISSTLSGIQIGAINYAGNSSIFPVMPIINASF